MNKTVFYWSLIIALGGFIFGFDTAVISGAEQSIQQYWGLNTLEHGLTVSIALIGTIIGALTGGLPSDRWGRKKTLYAIAILYLLSSLGTALSVNWYSFLFFRMLGGLGVGASSVTAPVYISEIAPPGKRGRLVGMFQFNIVLGIVVSYLSNYLIGLIGQPGQIVQPDQIGLTGGHSWQWVHDLIGEHPWRWMLGIQAVPSALFAILLRWVPESPRWLITRKGEVEAAWSIFKRIDPGTVDSVVSEILRTDKEEKATLQKTSLFSSACKTPVMLALLFAIFNQLSGINAIIYYAPRIFTMTGLGAGASLLSTVGIGIVNFSFTLLAMNFIDRVGRRTLMLIGSLGLIATLGMVAFSFYATHPGGWVVPALLFIYIAFFAFSQGAVIWVFISEIFPNQVRARGQTLGSTAHWVMAAIVAFSFPYVTEKAGGGNTFLFFTIMMCLQLLFVLKLMPETKGKSLEQIEHTMILH